MTDILENTTAPLAETASPAPAEVATSEPAPAAQAATAEPALVAATPPPVAAEPIVAATPEAEAALSEKHDVERDTRGEFAKLVVEAEADAEKGWAWLKAELAKL